MSKLLDPVTQKKVRERGCLAQRNTCCGTESHVVLTARGAVPAAPQVHFLHSADLPKSLPPSSTSANGHPGDGGPAAPGPHAPAGHSASVQAFLPYLHYYLEPYDEKAFRALLERCGWPLVAPPPPAATN